MIGCSVFGYLIGHQENSYFTYELPTVGRIDTLFPYFQVFIRAWWYNLKPGKQPHFPQVLKMSMEVSCDFGSDINIVIIEDNYNTFCLQNKCSSSSP